MIIATLNRAPLLADALEALVAQSEAPTEVVVVDNGSTDATPEVVARFRDRLNLVYVVESRRGVAHARNRGIATARGEILAFIDDDCLPGREWLERMVDRFMSDPSIGVVGGVTQPRRPEARSWIARFCYELFSREETSCS